MRIARPGCVVGPQQVSLLSSLSHVVLTYPLQQYMYQRQLDWAKWSALDQARKEQEASLAAAQAARAVTPPVDDKPLPLVPTTPSRPSLASMTSAAEVEALLPPGQPRKTPTTKRVALEMLEDDDEGDSDDSNGSLLGVKTKSNPAGRGTAPVVKQLRSMSPSGKTTIKTTTAVGGPNGKTTVSGTRTVPATASRATRATTRTQALVSPRKGPAPSVGGRATPIAPLSLVPRPASRAREEPVPNRTRAATQLTAQRNTRPTPSKIPARKLNRVASPPPALPSSSKISTTSVAGGFSRLPTMVTSKRSYVGKALPTPPLPPRPATAVQAVVSIELDVVPERPSQDDAWMSGVDAKAVVEPATKSGRPSIRSVRRRRSSFSSADIL